MASMAHFRWVPRLLLRLVQGVTAKQFCLSTRQLTSPHLLGYDRPEVAGKQDKGQRLDGRPLPFQGGRAESLRREWARKRLPARAPMSVDRQGLLH